MVPLLLSSSSSSFQPGILYETADADETATGLPFTSVSCNCNGTTPGFHIVSCLLYPVTCRNDGSHLCLGERDVWLFDVVTGQLEQRATCLDCTGHVPGVAETVGLDADLTAAACEEWQDTCFLAQYGNHDGDTNDNGVEDVAGRDDMTSCSLVYTELDVECTQCDPCTAADRDDGQVEWGMIFDCPGWNSRGDCVTSSRLGHHPWDVVEPLLDPDSSTQSTTAPTGSPPTSSVQRNNDDDNDDDKDAQQLLIIMAVVAGVAVFCCGIFLGRLFLGGSGRHDNNRRRRETMAADDDDGMGPAAREGVGYENNDDQATEDDESSYQSASVYDDTTTAHHAAPAPTLRDINIADKLDTTGSTDDSFAANL